MCLTRFDFICVLHLVSEMFGLSYLLLKMHVHAVCIHLWGGVPATIDKLRAHGIREVLWQEMFARDLTISSFPSALNVDINWCGVHATQIKTCWKLKKKKKVCVTHCWCLQFSSGRENTSNILALNGKCIVGIHIFYYCGIEYRQLQINYLVPAELVMWSPRWLTFSF